MSDSNRDNSSDSLSEQQLDRLLASARWPSIDERLQKLSAQWDAANDANAETNILRLRVEDCLPQQPVSVDHSSVATAASAPAAARTWRFDDWWKLAVVAAAILLMPLPVQILFPPIAQIALPDHEAWHIGNAGSIEGSKKLADSTAEPKIQPIITPATKSKPSLDDVYATIFASQQSRRQKSTDRRGTLLERAVQTIGRSDLLSATLEVAIARIDRTMMQLSVSKQIGDRRLAHSYASNKRRWERWLWNQAKNRNDDQRLALARVATILATQQSVSAVVAQINTELEFVSVRAIVRLGSLRDLERSLRETSRTRSQTILLSRLLTYPDARSASLFLKYLKRSETKSVAVKLLKSTDMLPTEIWLRMIAARQGEQWDAAYAVSHVCDSKATGGLIELAMAPGSARPAMLALLASPCDEAKQFVAFAERDELLASQVYGARKKLKQFQGMFN